jgi:hypothetical protein
LRQAAKHASTDEHPDATNRQDIMLSVALAGHRSERSETQNLPAVLQVLDTLVRQLSTVSDVADCWPPLEGRPSLRFLSGGADGFDTLALEVVGRAGYPGVVIGVDPQDMVRNREWSTEGILFPARGTPGSPRFDSVVAARDEWLVAHSDLLVVLWDGGAARGLQGGTVRLIREAALTGREVVWIDPQATLRMLDPLRVDDEVCRALQADDADEVLLAGLFIPFESGYFTTLMRRFVSLGAAAGAQNREELTALTTLCQKTPGVLERRAGMLEKMVLAAIAPHRGHGLRGIWASVRHAARHDTSRAYYLVDFSAEECQMHQEPESLKQSFGFFDVSANVRAGKLRDTIWVQYLLAAFAVFSAVAGSFQLGVAETSHFWGYAELVAIAAVMVLFLRGRAMRWHRLWLSFRYMAELIRYARMCNSFLAVPTTLQTRLFRPMTADPVTPGNTSATLMLSSPEEWLVRRVLLSAIPPQPALNAASHYEPQTHIEQLAEYARRVISDQRKFHLQKHKQYKHAAHALHQFGTLCFSATALAVVMHFVLHRPWMLLLTAALPALASSLHGITNQTELARLASVSRITSHELDMLHQAINRILTSTGDEAIAWLRLRRLVSEAAHVMSGSAEQWQSLIEHRETALPA